MVPKPIRSKLARLRREGDRLRNVQAETEGQGGPGSPQRSEQPPPGPPMGQGDSSRGKGLDDSTLNRAAEDRSEEGLGDRAGVPFRRAVTEGDPGTEPLGEPLGEPAGDLAGDTAGGRTGPASSPRRRGGRGMPGWLGARLGKQRAHGAGTGPASGATPALTSVHSGGRGAPPLIPLDERARRAMELWPTESGDPGALREFTRDEGVFAARVQRLDVGSCQHGDWRLGEIDGASATAIARLAVDEGLTGVDLRRAVYLDTETTGLSGGAGVYVFMIGLGWFEGDVYVSWQGFLRHPGEERALLAEVAERLRGASALVSFFGKSFDRHRLQDKMRIAGVEPPFEGLPHLDLYHPFRRLTGDTFGNGKLQTMERELLGFHREKDLPGSLAPAAWFDFLGSRPHRLEGVFLHNHEDVLSLVVLTALLGRVQEEVRVSGDELPGPPARRAWALARTASSPAEELRWIEACLARGAADPDRRAARVRRAHLLRRASRWEEARKAYREGLDELDNDRAALELLEGASMLLEHGLKDRALARTFAVRARDLGKSLGVAAARSRALAARVERLDATGRLVGEDPGSSDRSAERGVGRPGDQDPAP